MRFLRKLLRALAFASVFMMLSITLSACTPATTKEEADIIVIDPTSDGAAWRDARENVMNRVINAFGESEVEGKIVGSGATGNVTIVPVGADTNITDVIRVLDYENLSGLRNSLYEGMVFPRALDIYNEILSGDKPSIWKYIAETQLGTASALKSFSKMNCQTSTMSEIDRRVSDSKKLPSALENALSNGFPQEKLVDSLCSQADQVAKGISAADKTMEGKARACMESESGNGLGCSDILSATKVVSILLSDLARIDKAESASGRKTFNACTLYASDMMHYDNEGPLLIRAWDRDSTSGEVAKSNGQASSINYLGRNGYPILSGGTEVYMPYLGKTTFNKKRGIHELNELQFFWTAFFEESGAEIRDGSSKVACSGLEPHNNY